MRQFLLPVAFLALALALPSTLVPARAQAPRRAAERTLDAAERKAVIDGVLEKVEANYVFPDVGKKMAAAVRDAAGEEGVRRDHRAARNWPRR